MARIIAIANQKGGVGKTTTAFNLGAALALQCKKKVLLVDIDPQANLSEYLGYKEDVTGRATMTQLIAKVSQTAVCDSEDVKNSIRYNQENSLYYIPADINLANAETMMSSCLSRETILKRILSEDVTRDFDYVLIDCLPSLGILLINALTVANDMLIPVQTQKFSMDGLAALIELRKQICSTINPTLNIMGILPTMTDNTTVTKNALLSLNERYNGMILNTTIDKSIEAAKSSESGKALCRYKTKLGTKYIELAKEISRY